MRAVCSFCYNAFEAERLGQAYCCGACLDAGMDGDYENLDPDVWCLKHGRLLATKGSSYCEDCEPPEPDGECFRGGEAAGYLAEQQAKIQRELK